VSSAAKVGVNAVTLLAAAVILRQEAEKDTSPSQNDAADLNWAAAVCEWKAVDLGRV
jgi:hypothetical protein